MIERLTRWMLRHTQPEPLDLDHGAQIDLAWAADEIYKLHAELAECRAVERKLEKAEAQLEQVREVVLSHDPESWDHDSPIREVWNLLNSIAGEGSDGS